MKIICDSCGAKYSIADEKIAGKVFKIRCKKCSHVLVVRGDQVSADPAADTGAAAAGAAASAPEAIWHVVVGGDQQGPYSPAQLAQMMTAGQIDWEAYVWREGFEGWVPARDVPELVEAISGGQPQQPAAQQPAPEPAAGGMGGLGDDPFAQAGSGGLGADPFGEDESTRVADTSAFSGAAAQAGTPEAEAPAASDSPDLFAQAQAADPTSGAFGGEDDVVASQPGPRVSAEQALTGQRNENSVLFSLSNLQALATGGSDASTPLSSAPAGGGSEGASPRAGYAGGEGSGLIDIRALASAAATTGGESKDENIDALLSIGGAPVGPGLAAPVLAPPVEPEKDNKKLMLGLGIGGAVVVAAAIVTVVVVLGGKDEEPAAQQQLAAATQAAAAKPPAQAAGAAQPAGAAAPAAKQPAAQQPAAQQPAQGQPAPAAQPSAGGGQGDTAAAAADEGQEQAGGGSAAAEGRRSRRRNVRRGGRRGGSSAPSAAAAPSASSRGGSSSRGSSRRSGGGGGDIDSLLEQAIGGGGGGGRSRSRRSSGGGGGSSNANLPAQPSRSQVLAAMGRVKGAVSRCAQAGEKGRTVQAAITVRGSSGRVSAVNVSGSVSPATRSCVARAVRRATFPKFKRDTFKINFPFRL